MLPLEFESFSIRNLNSPVAQLVEQLTVNQWVPGSSPGRGANFSFPSPLASITYAVFGSETHRHIVFWSMEIGKYNQKAKYGMALAGYDCGITRPSHMPLSDSEKATYKADFDFMKG
jgi:hypothetical protein